MFLGLKNDQVQKKKKACKMKKKNPINMKIPRAHFQIVGNECVLQIFRKIDALIS